jgi:hypothetical protein
LRGDTSRSGRTLRIEIHWLSSWQGLEREEFAWAIGFLTKVRHLISPFARLKASFMFV